MQLTRQRSHASIDDLKNEAAPALAFCLTDNEHLSMSLKRPNMVSLKACVSINVMLIQSKINQPLQLIVGSLRFSKDPDSHEENSK
jgi:hypothetical protein